MLKIIEQRYLIKVQINYEKDKGFIFSFINKKGINPGAGRRSVRIKNMSTEQFANFLKKINAYDDKEDPRTKRVLSYPAMAYEIMMGKDNIIYIWSNYINEIKSLEEK